MKQETLNILTAYLQGELPGTRPFLYKGNEELLYLRKWLTEEAQPRKVIIDDISDYLRQLVDSCSNCNNANEKKYGIGSGANHVMIILNAPKLMNKLERDVYKQESIDLLKKMVAAIKLQFSECYITNLVKCEVNDTLIKPSQILENCSKIIVEEVKHMRPSVVIVMGDIVPLQKIIKNSTGIEWFNIEHPITLIKTPELKRNAWSTLKLVMEAINSL